MTPEGILAQFAAYPKVLDCPIKILGMRGASGSGNRMGIYDDQIAYLIDKELKVFRASTDPGQYYINHPLNPQGCAQLQCGLWSYRLGMHHGIHPALVQADQVTVNRLDPKGVMVKSETGWFDIHIHSGGSWEFEVGRWSAGCQVIATDEAWADEWLEFFTPIQEACRYLKVTDIPYLLVDSLKPIPVTEPIEA